MRRLVENFGSMFWLFMDAMWMLDCKTVAILLIPFVMAGGISMFWTHRKSILDTLVNSATCGWIGMNVCWMLGDFYKGVPVLDFMKMVCFIAGLISVLIIAAVDFRYLKNFKRFK